MRTTRLNKVIVIGLAAVTAGLAVAAGASAFDQTVIPFEPGDPLTNGCPAGWEALEVSDLTPHGYQLPSLLDSTANGGNGDGIVCGKPLTPQAQDARFPNALVPVIFIFDDNDLPPAGR
jgi:hypothetical protein